MDRSCLAVLALMALSAALVVGIVWMVLLLPAVNDDLHVVRGNRPPKGDEGDA